MLSPLAGGMLGPLATARGGAGSSLMQGVYGAWSMNEDSGTRLDAAGSSRHLLETGGLSGVAAKFGNGVQCADDATPRYLKADGLTLPTEMSISLWFKTPAIWPYTGSVFPTLINIGSNQRVIVYGYSANANLYIDFYRPVGTGGTSFALQANTWYHLYLEMDGPSTRQGASLNNAALWKGATGTVQVSSNICIGARASDGSQRSNFIVDELVAWSRVLTTSERTSVYNAGAGKTYPF